MTEDDQNEAGSRPPITPERMREIMDTPKRPPERSPCFLLYHRKDMTPNLVEQLIRVSTLKDDPTRKESFEDRIARRLRIAERDRFTNIDTAYQFKREDGPPDKLYSTQFSIGLKMMPFEVRMHEMVRLEAMLADSDHWMKLTGQKGAFRWDLVDHMNWFLDKCRPFLPIMEPNLAFADTENAVVRNLRNGEDPFTLAWPLMIFGPKEVERIGREKLEDSPAWKVETLPYGGIWVQVWENPFDAPQKMVTALAKHLGLEARKG